MIEKRFLFKSPNFFEFKESGWGLLKAGENHAVIDWNNKVGEVKFDGKFFFLKGIDFIFEMARPELGELFITKILTEEEWKIGIPDVAVWGYLDK